MKLTKFIPTEKAYTGKLYQKLISPSMKRIKVSPRSRIKSKGGTLEYYKKKYLSPYGRVRYSRAGEKVASKVSEMGVPVRREAKRYKGLVSALKKKIEATPELGPVLVAAPAVASIPVASYLDKKLFGDSQSKKSGKRKQRSDKGKKRGSYRT